MRGRYKFTIKIFITQKNNIPKEKNLYKDVFSSHSPVSFDK